MDALDIARQGAMCLADLQRRDGSFRYRYDHISGEKLSGYNVLRHAGSIWSILDVYQDTRESRLLDCGRTGVTFLLDRYLRFYRDYHNACICEDNKIKLGGNALSILALITLFELTGDLFLRTLAERLGSFMLEQRDSTDDMIHKRYFKSGKISTFKSMYYTGEALLALLALYRCTRNGRWLMAVLDMEEALAEEDYGVEEQSHWMLYSLEALSRYRRSSVYDAHAAKIACHILDHPAYLDWGRSTPIACRTEGLLAFMRMERTEGELYDDLLAKCWRQIDHNLARQQEYLQSDGAFIRGGEDQRNNEVRIDYIQHNISAFLHYHRFVEQYAARSAVFGGGGSS